MIFEQPKELNVILLPPAVKAARLWLLVKLLGAPLLIGLLFMVEILIVKGRAMLPFCGVLLVFPLLGFLILFLVQGQQDRSSRSVQIEEDGLQLKPGAGRKIPWSDVVGFRFEPAGPQGHYEKLTVRYREPSRRAEFPWRMILTDEAQCEAILAVLEKRQTMNPGRFTVEILGEPDQLKSNSSMILSIWLLFLGMFFLMHGLIALVSGVSFLRRDAAEQASNLLILSWHAPFATAHDLGRFLVELGGGMTMFAIGCLVLFVVLLKKAGKAAAAGAVNEAK